MNGCRRFPWLRRAGALAIAAFGILPLPADPGPTEGRAQLAHVQSAAYYEIVTDGASIGRTREETLALLRDVQTQLIFRGFMQGPTVPEDASHLPAELCRHFDATSVPAVRRQQWYLENGYSFRALEEALPPLRRGLPGVVFVGGIAAQFVSAVEYNAMTGRTLGVEETWALAFDPARWQLQRDGQALTKAQWQSGAAGGGATYDWRHAAAFFPDLTSPEFQELLLARAYRQINAGVDGIWIDLLFRQAALVAQLGGADHEGVRASYDAAGHIVKAIHQYGAAHGRNVLVGTWALPLVRFPFPPPDVDFVTLTPQPEEILRRRLDSAKWESTLATIRARCGEIPVLVFIDCAGDRGVMAQFSQQLEPAEQRALIRQLNAFCRQHGLVFAAPLHGGGMGDHATCLSFGRSKVYDSVAPEFQTYATIRELAAAVAAPAKP